MKFASRLSALMLALALTASAWATELDSVVRTIPGTASDFTQSFTPKGFTRAQVERGTVIFGGLPKMRWSYSGNEPRLFVFDGEKSSLYTPAEKQVQVVTLDASRQKSIPFAFLWNPAAMRDYVYRERRRGTMVEASMRPANRSAELRQIDLKIDAASHAIRRVEYFDRNGNRTVFEFSPFRQAVITSDTFHFVPPPGVEVLSN